MRQMPSRLGVLDSRMKGQWSLKGLESQWAEWPLVAYRQQKTHIWLLTR